MAISKPSPSPSARGRPAPAPRTRTKPPRDGARFALPTWLSIPLVAVAASAAAFGVFDPSIFRDPAMTAGNARGTALVILVLALPVLIGSIILTWRGSLRAQLVWLGALGYILYNSFVFAFAVHFNGLFLLYVAMLSLAFWSLLTLLRRLDPEVFRAHAAPGLPLRFIAGVLVVLTLLFFATWMRDIVPALIDHSAPAGLEGTGMLTNPFQVMDLSVVFALQLLTAVWLWRRRAWGFLLAPALLVMQTIESVSVASDQTFGHLADSTQSLAAVPLFAVLALVVLVPTVIMLRGIQEKATG